MSTNNWYYLLNNQQYGPVADRDLKSWIENGKIMPDVYVWSEGMSNWAQASSLSLFRLQKNVSNTTLTMTNSQLVENGTVCNGTKSQNDANVQNAILIPENEESSKEYAKLKVNRRIQQEATCYSCKQPFELAEEIIKCLNCDSFYHKACWSINNGCINSSCKTVEDTFEVETGKKCPNCGKEVKSNAMKCKYCGSILDKELKEDEEIISKGNAPGAVSSLVVGIIGLFLFGFILGWSAIGNGRSALKKIEEDPGYSGKGFAIAGIIMGVIDIAGWVIALLSRLG